MTFCLDASWTQVVADISALFSYLDVVSRDNLRKYFLHYIRPWLCSLHGILGGYLLRQPEQPEEFAIDDQLCVDCWSDNWIWRAPHKDLSFLRCEMSKFDLASRVPSLLKPAPLTLCHRYFLSVLVEYPQWYNVGKIGNTRRMQEERAKIIE